MRSEHCQTEIRQDIHLFILVDNVDAASLISAVSEAEVCVHGSSNYHIIQSITINIADSHCVAKVGPDLVAGEVVELLHRGSRQKDHLARQVGAPRHAHRDVGVGVPVEMSQSEGVAQVGVVLALGPLLGGEQIQTVEKIHRVRLSLPVITARSTDKKSLLQLYIWIVMT